MPLFIVRYLSFEAPGVDLGGKLYIEVRDDATIVGINDPDKVSLRISNMVRDAIKPDMMMFLTPTQRSTV